MTRVSINMAVTAEYIVRYTFLGVCGSTVRYNVGRSLDSIKRLCTFSITGLNVVSDVACVKRTSSFRTSQCYVHFLIPSSPRFGVGTSFDFACVLHLPLRLGPRNVTRGIDFGRDTFGIGVSSDFVCGLTYLVISGRQTLHAFLISGSTWLVSAWGGGGHV
jgi:hypothetical protein